MIRLHLLGFTPDLKGLVFSGRRGGRSGTYWVAVEDEFWKALEQLEGARALREEEVTAAKADKRKPKPKPKPRGKKGPQEALLSDVPLDEVRKILARRGKGAEAEAEPEPPAPPRPESKLTPREVQGLLREGRSVRDVAARAGVDEAWVERFMGPVLHEMSGVVTMTQASHQDRPRLGRSGLPIGPAVQRNLQDRKATTETIESLAEGWDARRTRSGMWRVRLRFRHRGKRRTAEWEYSKESREVRPRDQLARELGWWPSDRAKARVVVPAPGAEGDEPPTRKAKPKAKPKPKAKAKPKAKRRTAKRPAARKRRR